MTTVAAGRALSDRFRLDDKVVVVTGASSGLGVAFAHACAEAGADIVAVGRRRDRLEQTVELVGAAGREGLAVAVDVAAADGCRSVVDAAVGRFGRIDVLVNNAGVEDHAPASRLAVEDFRRVLDVNVTACFELAQGAAAVMPRGSSIVNVGSIMAYTTLDIPTTAYCTSKAAVLGLTRSLARQWSGRRGIRVNALLPGFFPTDMVAALPQGLLDDRLPMGRMGDPDELAAALVFLASDASSYMTGSELTVDGGMRLT
ncbi:SDR family NAD(P)-dependent oxidoreductase [Mycolicibacterium tusciae]|jgi:NAD(P)-dependent dehydrogenase (short-subunit alcohol dehydrogenase family)|uniref:Short-chain dehydrogenase n=1 Tax=Mycolicibacterium tusciae TaxID=75922 RepID=A0A1X0JKJ0_9MYCO|nr:SDR family oxidoreductase [Mycolicibacterium tusciae]ORB63354.1 short-chain dehydrogenase [Mycolicibacterium tusciae]